MKEQWTVGGGAEEFFSDFLHQYLEQGNFSAVLAVLHKDISWFGINRGEICKNKAETEALLAREKAEWKRKSLFTFLERWQKSTMVDEKTCFVYGKVLMKRAKENTLGMEMCFRVSALCLREDDGWKLFQIHFSVACANMLEEENVHQAIAETYNIKLEEMLQKRTALLRNKTIELQTLTKNMMGAVEICLYDEHFTIVYASEGFRKLTGYTRNELRTLLGNRHTALVEPSDTKRLKEEIDRQVKLDNSFTVEYSIRHKDGSVIWVLDKGVLLPAEVDGIVRVQCLLMDITEQKRQAAILEQKNMALETLTNNVDAAIIRCSFDKDFTMFFATDGLFHMLGYTREQFAKEKGNRLGAVIYEEDWDTMDASLQEQLLLGDTTAHINRMVRRDGSIFWVLAKGTRMELPDGTYEFRGVLTDVTEQQQKEEALRVSEKRYEIAMQLSEMTMFEYNVLTKELILFENDLDTYEVERFVANGMESMIASGVVMPNSVADFQEMYRKIHAGEPYAKCNVETKDKDGNIRAAELSLTNIFDKNGKPVRAIGVRKNISDLVLLKKEEEFGKTLVSNKRFVCEANITTDTVRSINVEWAKEAGVPRGTNYSEMIELGMETRVVEEYKDVLRSQLHCENLTRAYEAGERLRTFTYKRTGVDEQYAWYEGTVNIIKESISGDINIRFYIDNVDAKKRKAQKALEEQRLYETMVAKAISAYELNITTNRVLAGHEDWESVYHVQPSENYDEMIVQFAGKAIHVDDRKAFLDAFQQERVLRAYDRGDRVIACAYQKLGANSGHYTWVNCSLHLYEDPETGDVKGYSYVEDIDAQKRAELALLFSAEHDVLTGLLNKGATEKQVEGQLLGECGLLCSGAFIMIDVDYFKLINDNFGHAFGDAVLAQTASKIAALFREDDVVGRIGGDEFAVFIRNLASPDIAITKAKEICSEVYEVFQKKDESFRISASIGIAVAPQHGGTYGELYKHADAALYTAKKNGRNQYRLYHGGMEEAELGAKEIDVHTFLEAKGFEDNLSEYIFSILYDSPDKEAAIQAVLSLIGKHFTLSRVYIFEDSADGASTRNTFEWCNEGIVSHKEWLRDLSHEELANYRGNFGEDDIFYMPDRAEATPALQKILGPQVVQSMIQFAIRKNKKFVGFIGFDECKYTRPPSRRELTLCRNIAQILGVFLQEMRAVQRSEAMENIAMAIVNGLDSYAYVCNPDTYEVLFINERAMGLAPNARVGQRCHEVFWGNKEPCAICPMRSLRTEQKNRCSMDMHNQFLNVWVKATSAWIPWSAGEKVCLIESVDVTEYKTYRKE